MSKETNQNEDAPAWGETNFESCKIEVLENGTHQVVNFTKTKVFFTGTYQECYVWVLKNHKSFKRCSLISAPKMNAKVQSQIFQYDNASSKFATEPKEPLNLSKTSLDWFLNELFKNGYLKRLPVIEMQQAKAMHKQEILIAYSKALPITDGVFTAIDKANDYYTETFGGYNE